MPLGDYLLGLLIIALTWGAAIVSGWLVVDRRVPRVGGLPRFLAVAMVALAALIAAHLLPGLVGLLSRWSALAVSLALAALVWRLVPRLAGAARDDTPG